MTSDPSAEPAGSWFDGWDLDEEVDDYYFPRHDPIPPLVGIAATTDEQRRVADCASLAWDACDLASRFGFMLHRNRAEHHYARRYSTTLLRLRDHMWKLYDGIIGNVALFDPVGVGLIRVNRTACRSAVEASTQVLMGLRYMLTPTANPAEIAKQLEAMDLHTLLQGILLERARLVALLASMQVAGAALVEAPKRVELRVSRNQAEKGGRFGHIDLPPTARSTLYGWMRSAKAAAILGIDPKISPKDQRILVHGLLKLQERLPPRASGARKSAV